MAAYIVLVSTLVSQIIARIKHGDVDDMSRFSAGFCVFSNRSNTDWAGAHIC